MSSDHGGPQTLENLSRAVLCGLLLSAGCTGERSPQGGFTSPPNVLLISLDTTRRDHLSVYGYSRATSPSLEALAGDGIRFDLAYAPSATTGPTHASVFTGLYPLGHGVIKNGLTLDDRFLTLAEAFSKNGYQTSAVVSSFVLDSKFGYAQGFDYYEDEFRRETSTIKNEVWEGHTVERGFDRTADETTRLASQWLEELRTPNVPFLLFVHYFDPHSPYVPPAEFEAGIAREDETALTGLSKTILDYDAEIAFTDREVGRLLAKVEELGLERSTIVAVTADHGEGLMQHGHLEHGLHIYEEAVRVPLIMRWPGRLAAGQSVAEPVEILDLGPSLVSLVGAAGAMSGVHGRDLGPNLLDSEPWDPGREIYLFRRHYRPRPNSAGPRGIKTGIRSGRWKYILGHDDETRELFDLSRDPGENNNIAAEWPEERERLEQRLTRWRSATASFSPAEQSEIDAEDRERLRALGYLD